MTPADRTAQYVAMHTHTVQRRRVPRAQPPTLVESEFGASLVGFVHEWRHAAASILPAERTDSIHKSRPALQRARSALSSTISRTHSLADRTARRVSQHSKAQLARQTQAALGVPVPTPDTDVPPRIQAFVHENVALIQRLGNATLDSVETILTRAYAEGKSTEDVADDIAARFDIADRHARFIARDQVQRLYSQVTRMRHEEIGVVTFRWMTEHDGRVRPAHAVKHGRVFPYDGSRAPSFFPGDEVGCRCWEEPVFDELRTKAGVGRRRVT